MLILGVSSDGLLADGAIQQTTHITTIAGEEIEYQAIIDEFIIESSDKSSTGNLTSFTYLKSGGDKTRPIVFMFNGGPGSASHWLHLGGFGPKHIDLASETPPTINTNKDSLLPHADLVFIDPIGTGFSNTGVKSPLPFWNIVEDAKSVSRFIEAWLKAYTRTESPLYIAGESYGSLRATLVADELLRVHNRETDGLILLSPVQNYRNIRLPDGSVMGYISYLPTYAATAWQHGKVSKADTSLNDFLDEVRDFASGAYASALIAGNRLSESEIQEIANKLSKYIGLSASDVLAHDLRVNPITFLQKLLAQEGNKLSRLDSRQFALAESSGSQYGQDPFAQQVREPFVAATRAYLKDHLQAPVYRGTYKTTARGTRGWRWDWNVWGKGNVPSGSRFINVIPNLERTLKNNQTLRVYIGMAYYDFATPFYGAENAFAELASGHERLAISHFPSGHLIYLDTKSRAKLSDELTTFITSGNSN